MSSKDQRNSSEKDDILLKMAENTYIQLCHADINEGTEHDYKIKWIPRIPKIIL